MKPYEIKKHAESFDITVESAVRMRVRYLVQLVNEWYDYIMELTAIPPESSLVDALDEIIEMRIYEKRYKKISDKNAITDEMIQAAKNYPVERLIEFVRGAAIAWCHEDKKPSLVWDRKRNKARCFPCDQSYSSIDILMQRDGMTFIQAVKELSQ